MAVEGHGLQPLPVLFPELLCRFRVQVPAHGAIDEEPVGDHVLAAVEQDAAGLGPVPPGPARLLVVAFQVLWHIVVDHQGDVGLVDAHAEGVGGDHNGLPVVEEILLIGLALLVGEAGVVAGGGEALPAEELADLLHGLPGGAVDDGALVTVLPEDFQELGLLVPGLPDLEVEVWPVEAGGQDHGVPELQNPDDVLPDLGRGRGGKGADHRPPGQRLDEARDFQVTGPEILAPLGNAVGLVHADHENLRASGEVQELLGLQPLRRHVEDAVGPRPGVLHGPAVLGRGQGAVQIRRPDPRLSHGPHLVLHQGDQGRDHQGDPIPGQGRNLVAQGFSRPGGHDPQGVPAFQDGPDQRLLPAPEGVVAEDVFQNLLWFHGCLLYFSKQRSYSTVLSLALKISLFFSAAAKHLPNSSPFSWEKTLFFSPK